MIAMVYEEPHLPRLYDADDLPWIGRLLDIVERSLGEPWRVLVERVEQAPLAVHASHRTAMLQALRRVLGQRARSGPARGLGPPALEDVESLLWVDLAMERPVALPGGRPAEAELAGFANLERIQRWVRRAHELQLRVWARAGELVRTAARHGVIAQVQSDGDATRLDLVGPLALFHSTMVYGRALAALMPLLADHPRFELDIRCRLRGEDTHVRVVPPVMLPPARVSPRRAPSVAERLARDLSELGHTVEREPPPITSGPHLLFSDLALVHGGTRWLIEVLGFSTPHVIATRLAHYRRAGAAAMLCVDLATAPGCELEARVCGFTGHVAIDDLLATLEAGP